MKKILLLLTAALAITASGRAQSSYDEIPTINPTATYTTEDGEEESEDYSGNAPLAGRFEANPENVGEYTASYEWRFSMDTDTEPYLIRYEQDTEYTFTKAGTHNIVLYALFVNGNDEQILLSARLDNLGKGASGAAVQNMNIALGLDEGVSL